MYTCKVNIYGGKSIMYQNAYLRNQLTDQELILVNSEIQRNGKNPVIAYLLWFFFGYMGGHRYYMGKIGSAVAMTLIFWIGVWFLGLGAIICGIWELVDVFLIHVWIRDDNAIAENQAINQILMRKQNQAGANPAYNQTQYQPQMAQSQANAQNYQTSDNNDYQANQQNYQANANNDYQANADVQSQTTNQDNVNADYQADTTVQPETSVEADVVTDNEKDGYVNN